MDKKVNEFLRKYLSSSFGKSFQTTLPEKIACSHLRHLPRPFTVPQAALNFNSPMFDQNSLLELEVSTPTRDQMRWVKLPDEIREEAKNRMHAFLLLKSDDMQQVGASPFSPYPLSLRGMFNNEAASA